MGAVLIERVRSKKLALPLLSTVAVEVLGLVDDSGEVRTLAELVQRDPALAAHVLRESNSTRYAPTVPIVSLNQAIGRVGLARFRELVLSVAVRAAVFDVRGHEDEVERLWSHAQSTGLVAKEIARLRRANVEAAFLAGLLHDIGAPVVIQGVVDLCREHGDQLLGSDPEASVARWVDEHHAEVGQALVESWNLPDWVTAVVADHHGEAAGHEHEELLRTVALADEISDWLAESGGEGVPPGVEHAEALDLYAEDVEELCSRTAEMLGGGEAA